MSLGVRYISSSFPPRTSKQSASAISTSLLSSHRAEWSMLRDSREGYKAALVYFKERSAKCQTAGEWDASIYTAILETMLNQRIGGRGYPRVFADVETILNHMNSMGIQMEESLFGTLIRAYSEEDEAVTKVIALTRLRITRGTLREEDPAESDDLLSSALIKDLERLLKTLASLNYMENALDLFQKGLSMDIDFDPSVYHAILAFYARRGNLEMAQKYFDLMKDNYQSADVETFSIMIRACGESGDKSSVRLWLDQYRQSSLEVTSLPYKAAIKAFVQCDDTQEAIHIMSDIMLQDSLTLSSGILAAFLEALLLKGQYAEVIQWFNKAKDDRSGQFPKVNDKMRDMVFCAATFHKDLETATTYFPGDPVRNPYVSAICDYGLLSLSRNSIKNAHGAFKKICSISSRSKLLGTPDTAFLIAMIDYYGSEKKMDAMLSILKRAKSANFSRHIIESALLRALGHMKSDFKKMLQTYRSAVYSAKDISFDAKSVRFALLESYEEFGKLGEDSSGPILNVDHFRTIFDVCFSWREGDNFDRQAARKRVFAALEDFQRRELKVSQVQFRRVLENFRKYKDSVGVADWIGAMRRIGLVKGPLMEGECVSSVTFDVKSDEIIFHCNSGEFEAALAVFNELTDARMHPHGNAILNLITGLGKAKRFNEMRQVVDKSLLLVARKPKPVFLRAVAIWEASILGYLYGKDIPSAIEMMNSEEPHCKKMRPNISKAFIRAASDEILSDSKVVDVTLLSDMVIKCHASSDDCSQELSNRSILVLLAAKKVEEAYSIYEKMARVDQKLRPQLAFELLDALLNRDMQDQAFTVLNDLVLRGKELSPEGVKQWHIHISASLFNRILYLLINKNCLKAAADFWNLALEIDLKPDAEVCGLFMNAFLDLGQPFKCVEVLDAAIRWKVSLSNTFLLTVLDKIMQNDTPPKVIRAFNGYVNAAVEWHTTKSTAESSTEPLFERPDAAVLESLSAKLLRVNDLDSCLQTYRLLASIGVPSLSLSNSLLSALMSESRISEAESIRGMIPSSLDSADTKEIEGF
ncbi:hypothetical protein HDU67_000897 [Dinochytrium kinnereticum]|nr:hypothetical protein HDU67_000897 [Dinochytrium kinnereticum]